MTPAQRTGYQSKYAKKRRLDLVKLLSLDGRCARCGEVFEHEHLTVNHVDGIDWDHNEVNQQRRYARYWREHASGVRLNALCGACNSSDGNRFRDQNEIATDEIPF
jgi:5-methylcytosine-specific restriction endonuclease McrA